VSRRPDSGVEERILNAALRLCQKGAPATPLGWLYESETRGCPSGAWCN
jgi:hypothetical protein